MNISMQIKFLNDIKGNLVLQVLGDMSIKEMVNKYSLKILENINKFGTVIKLKHNNKYLDVQSIQKIGTIFNQIDSINVEYSYNVNLEEKVVFSQQNIRSSMNEKIEKVEDKEGSTLGDMAILGCLEQKKAKQFSNNLISTNDSLNTNDKHLNILGILGKYLEKMGIDTKINPNETEENDKSLSYTDNILQFICNGYISKKKYVLNFGLKPKRVQQLHKDENERKKFSENLKSKLAFEYDLFKKDIIVTDFQYSEKYFSSIVIFKTNDEKNITLSDFKQRFQSEYELKYIRTVEQKPIIDTIILNKLILEPKFDCNDDSMWGQDEERGGEPYYPPIKWVRYGLKVSKRFDEGNDDWLQCDGRDGEWCLSYSGLSGLNSKLEQDVELEKDLKNPPNRVGRGVFTSPKPEIIEKNSEGINISGKTYLLALMLRVRPNKIRVPENYPDLWIVNGTADEIRPYGFLIKQIK